MFGEDQGGDGGEGGGEGVCVFRLEGVLFAMSEGVCVWGGDPGREVLAWGVFCDVGERGLIGAFVGMG